MLDDLLGTDQLVLLTGFQLAMAMVRVVVLSFLDTALEVPMVLIILRRDAPEVATLRACGLCGPAATTPVRDHLLVGSPGGSQQEKGVCGQCGDVLDRMVKTYGSDLTVIIQAGQAPVENLVSGPRKLADTYRPDKSKKRRSDDNRDKHVIDSNRGRQNVADAQGACGPRVGNHGSGGHGPGCFESDDSQVGQGRNALRAATRERSIPPGSGRDRGLCGQSDIRSRP